MIIALFFLAVLSGCSSIPVTDADGRGQDRYSAEHSSVEWTVTVRSGGEVREVEEVEIRGLLGARPLTASAEAIRKLGDGAFEVDLLKVAEKSTELGEPETARLIRNRGVQKIVFDSVGEAALRVRLSSGPSTAIQNDEDLELILNREQERSPAGVNYPYIMDRVGRGRH